MVPFRVHRGVVAPLFRRNIDTDQIIPKQFLKSTGRTGFGPFLFHDWRTGPDGAANPQFVLNDSRYAGASVLITGDNFGCGSSREHAAWALAEFGFRVLIAPSFADIFWNNAVTNGIVPVTLSEDVVSRLAEHASRTAGYAVEVDLDHCRVRDDTGSEYPFHIDTPARHRLLHGLDEIDLILQHESAIAQFERTRAVSEPPRRAVQDQCCR